MQTVSAIMLLLGCSHDVQLCEPAQLDQPYYESVEQCEGDIPAQRHYSEGYPITIVKCLEVDQLPADQAVQIQWHFNSNGILVAYAGPVGGDLIIDQKSDVRFALETDASTTK